MHNTYPDKSEFTPEVALALTTRLSSPGLRGCRGGIIVSYPSIRGWCEASNVHLEVIDLTRKIRMRLGDRIQDQSQLAQDTLEGVQSTSHDLNMSLFTIDFDKWRIAHDRTINVKGSRPQIWCRHACKFGCNRWRRKSAWEEDLVKGQRSKKKHIPHGSRGKEIVQ